jgi:peptidyl-prolyl cis-trans isomerase D
MTGKMQKTTSSIIAFTFIVLLILAFAMSGIQVGQRNDLVGRINGDEVTSKDFNQEYSRLRRQYEQFMGGKPLTAQQLKSFKVQETAWNNLVNKKLMLSLSSDVGVYIGDEELSKEIRELPYFQGANKKFDFNMYKLRLAGAEITSDEFEKTTREEMQVNKVSSVFNSIGVSDDFADAVLKIKNDKRKINLVRFTKEDLRTVLPISENEVTAFLQNPENLKKVEERFETQKGMLSIQEEVKARHILINFEKGEKQALDKINEVTKNLNAKNFADVAKKNSQDPGSQARGGDLGWFSRGRMVPEFEASAFTLKKGEISKPIKTVHGYHVIMVEDKKAGKDAMFTDHKSNLAKDIIRKTENVKFDAFFGEKLKEFKNRIINDQNYFDQLKKQSSGIYISFNSELTPLENRVGGVELEEKEVADIFKASDKDSLEFQKGEIFTLVFIGQKTPDAAKVTKDDFEREKNAQIFQLGNNLRQSLVEDLQKSATIKQYAKFE